MVTVIIPTLRRPRLLARAIRSVQAQTHHDLTIAVTDNASGDETRTVVTRLMADDPRIHYHEQSRNLGPHANFQHALDRVTTPYFALLSDDDLLLPHFVQQSLQVLEREPDAMFVASPVLLVDGDGRVLVAHGRHWAEGLHRPPAGLLQMTRRGHFIWTGVVFRTEVRERVRLDPDTGNCSDMDFQLQAAARYPFAFSRSPAAIFSWHPDSPTSHPGLSLFWPTWRKIMGNLQAVDELPAAARVKAVANLDRRLHRLLVLVGLYAAGLQRWDDAVGSAHLLRDRYRDDAAAAAVRLTAGLARRMPLIPPMLLWTADQIRWRDRWRLTAIQHDLRTRYHELLEVNPPPRASPAKGEGEAA